MSRIGNSPIEIPDGVTATINGSDVTVKGPKGELSQRLPEDITISEKDGVLIVARPTDRSQHRAFHGLSRSLVANMVEGVTNGYEKKLEMVGVGYRFTQKGTSVDVAAGFSHDVVMDPPEGVEFKVESQTELIITGIDKQLVGAKAAEIRALRPPEPYKGKGIRYTGEHVRRKIGKRAQ